jgi:hypothetical protein
MSNTSDINLEEELAELIIDSPENPVYNEVSDLINELEKIYETKNENSTSLYISKLFKNC